MRYQYQIRMNRYVNVIKSWICKFMPIGYSWKGELGINLAGLIFSILYANTIFQMHFMDNLEESGLTEEKVQVVYDNFMKTSFKEIVGSAMYIFLVFILAQFIWIAIHYYYHYVGVSKCIYTMRRIPAKLELHLRCMFFPAMTMILYILVAGMMLWGDYRQYINVMSVILQNN